MNPKKGILLLAMAGLLALGAEGCASRAVYVRTAPPPARTEVRPARPFANALWNAGYWRWNGRSYVWASGRWVKPKKGKTWVAGHWKKTRRGHVWVKGHWR